MEREAGLWIDHCKAVIVTIAYHGIGRIEPNVETQVRFSGVGSLEGWAGNLQDRRFESYLIGYYWTPRLFKYLVPAMQSSSLRNASEM